MARSKNTRLVAHIDCPGGGQVWVDGKTLYIGHMREPTGTTIVDVADPKNPVELARVTMPPGWHSHKVRVANGLRGFTESREREQAARLRRLPGAGQGIRTPRVALCEVAFDCLELTGVRVDARLFRRDRALGERHGPGGWSGRGQGRSGRQAHRAFLASCPDSAGQTYAATRGNACSPVPRESVEAQRVGVGGARARGCHGGRRCRGCELCLHGGSGRNLACGWRLGRA